MGQTLRKSIQDQSRNGHTLDLQLPHRRDSLTCDLLQSSGILACRWGVGGALNETSLPARSPRGVKFFSPVVAYRDVQGSIFTRSINFQGSFNLEIFMPLVSAVLLHATRVKKRVRRGVSVAEATPSWSLVGTQPTRNPPRVG